MVHDKVSISIDQLTVGVVCRHPIVSGDGVLLLGANSRITQQVITGLRERSFHAIEIDPRDVAVLRGDAPRIQTVKRERNTETEWAPAKPLKELLVDRFEDDFSDTLTTHLVSRLGVAKKQFDAFQVKLDSERIRSVDEFMQISDTYAHLMINDHDQTVSIMGTAAQSDALAERSVRMSVLGMSVAVELGLDGPQTLEVGMAGLLHDIGLYTMDPALRKPVESMTSSELWEYQKHPLVAVQCIADVMEVAYNVQMAIQQVHEQFDGSGYPRGVKGKRIHTYARILNVVDAYLQLTSGTSHRNAIVAHDALGLMLHQASRGIFDPQVIRAFLNIETLFPLGSQVELSSGELASVIRRPRSGFAAPVVSTLEGKRIELEMTNLQVVRPVCDPNLNQIRLSQEIMQTCLWNPAHAVAKH